MPHLNHRDIDTAYELIPSAASDETVVLVHGFTGGMLDFQDEFAWLADQVNVLALDQRGHGTSSHQGPYSLEVLARDLLSLLDHLQVGRVHLLGHSMGGMIALRAALAQQQRLASLILMDTAPGPVALLDNAMLERVGTLVTEHGCGVLLESMRQHAQPAHVQRGIDHLGEAEHWRRIRWKLEHMDPAAFVQLGKALGEQDDLTHQLPSLTIPVSVIVGEDDQPFVEPSKTMAALIPHASLHLIANAGHSPQYENRSGWRGAIEAHLTQAR